MSKLVVLPALCVALSATLFGCSASDSSNGAGGAAASGGTAGSGGASGGSGGSGGEPAPASMYKTFVLLGDSISDGGGEAPFYYTLLEHNDDARYPDYAGRDLTTRFGDSLVIVKRSKGGSKAPDLVTQVHGLPSSLEGPVLVVITIGGNDVKAALVKLLTTGDDSAERNAFAASLGSALGELTTPDRLGVGAAVHVLLSNIYDPSDGTGDFSYGSGKCPNPLGLYPAGQPTAPKLDPWEALFDSESAKVTGVEVLDLRTRFQGHGVNKGADTWFVSDCTHPNAVGHEQVRELFWDGVVGLP